MLWLLLRGRTASALQCSLCLQCVEDVEEALNSYLVHREENEAAKLQTFEQELSRLLVSSGPEELEHLLLAFIGQHTLSQPRPAALAIYQQDWMTYLPARVWKIIGTLNVLLSNIACSLYKFIEHNISKTALMFWASL